MKQLFITCILGLTYAFAQAQTVLTSPVYIGKQQQHSEHGLVARNEIIAPASATYTAGQSVILQPGFTAHIGSLFLAKIRYGPVNVKEDGGELRIAAYPNPFQQHTRIEVMLTQPGQVTYTLTDMKGRIIRREADLELKRAGLYQYYLLGDELPVGTYLYKLESGKLIQTIRLL